MNPRLITEVRSVPRRKAFFFTVTKPQTVWRILGAFTGEPEIDWYESEALAIAALARSEASEAHVLGHLADALSDGPRPGLSEGRRHMVIDAALEGDGPLVRRLLEEHPGGDAARNILRMLQTEKTYRDTYTAVLGDGSDTQ